MASNGRVLPPQRRTRWTDRYVLPPHEQEAKRAYERAQALGRSMDREQSQHWRDRADRTRYAQRGYKRR